jgi:hypothetical protein
MWLSGTDPCRILVLTALLRPLSLLPCAPAPAASLAAALSPPVPVPRPRARPHQIFYDVVHVSKADATSLENTLRRSMRPSAGVQHTDSLTGSSTFKTSGEKQGFVPLFDVPVEGDVENELDRIYRTYRDSPRKYGVEMPGDGLGKYGLLVLNMDKHTLAPPNVTAALAAKALKEGSANAPNAALSYAYRYTYGTGSGTDSFVSSGRFAVVDLSAGPSTYGNTQQGEGAVIASSIPRRSSPLTAHLDPSASAVEEFAVDVYTVCRLPFVVWVSGFRFWGSGWGVSC